MNIIDSMEINEDNNEKEKDKEKEKSNRRDALSLIGKKDEYINFDQNKSALNNDTTRSPNVMPTFSQPNQINNDNITNTENNISTFTTQNLIKNDLKDDDEHLTIQYKRKTLNECLKIISSNTKTKYEKVLNFNIMLIEKGFTFDIRKTLLHLIINFGINSNQLSAWTIKAQQHIKAVHNKQFTLEFLRFYIEYFTATLCNELAIQRDFLYLSYNSMMIKAQLLLIYYNRNDQESLIKSILDEKILRTYNYNTTIKAKEYIYKVMKNILDNCANFGFSKYENFFDFFKIVKCMNEKESDLIQIFDNNNKNDFATSIENLYNELFNKVLSL